MLGHRTPAPRLELGAQRQEEPESRLAGIKRLRHDACKRTYGLRRDRENEQTIGQVLI